MFGNSSNNPVAARRAGVRHASEAPISNGEPNKLLGAYKAEVVFVKFTNQRGDEEVGMYFQVNGALLSTSDTTEWTKKLHPMPEWLSKQVNTQTKNAEPVNVPDTDSVDVLDP